MQENAIYFGSPKAFHVFFLHIPKHWSMKFFHVFKAKTILKVKLYKEKNPILLKGSMNLQTEVHSKS